MIVSPRIKLLGSVDSHADFGVVQMVRLVGNLALLPQQPSKVLHALQSTQMTFPRKLLQFTHGCQMVLILSTFTRQPDRNGIIQRNGAMHCE